MKTSKFNSKAVLVVLLLLFFAPAAHGQILKKIGKKAGDAAERAIERRAEKEAEERTERALDSILEPGKKGKQKKDKKAKDKKASSDKETKTNPNSSVGKEQSKSLQIYSKFDFVPGDELLFYDDFTDDFIGDFPAKWNTDGSGEVVLIGDSAEKWFQLKSKSSYFPNIGSLPEDFTLEFDLKLIAFNQNTSSTARFMINLREDEHFGYFQIGDNLAAISLPLAQYAAFDIKVVNRINDKNTINNGVEADIRAALMANPHISIAVNGSRCRLWVNETKYLDLPKLLVPNLTNFIRFDLKGLEDAAEHFLIKNITIKKGGLDLRRVLIAEGKVSTNGILFASGSAQIQPQSMGIIRQISQVLLQERDMNLKIIGHTDADGKDNANLVLSEKRAAAVMNVLINVFAIAPERLVFEGKGESQPLGDNNTISGKAQNRRVEFITQ